MATKERDLSWIQNVDHEYCEEWIHKIINKVAFTDQKKIVGWYTFHAEVRWYINKLAYTGEVYIGDLSDPLAFEFAETLINNGYKVTYDSENNAYLIEEL